MLFFILGCNCDIIHLISKRTDSQDDLNMTHIRYASNYALEFGVENTLLDLLDLTDLVLKACLCRCDWDTSSFLHPHVVPNPK